MRHARPPRTPAALVVTVVLLGLVILVAVVRGGGVGLAEMAGGLIVAVVLGVVGLLKGRR